MLSTKNLKNKFNRFVQVGGKIQIPKDVIVSNNIKAGDPIIIEVLEDSLKVTIKEKST